MYTFEFGNDILLYLLKSNLVPHQGISQQKLEDYIASARST